MINLLNMLFILENELSIDVPMSLKKLDKSDKSALSADTAVAASSGLAKPGKQEVVITKDLETSSAEKPDIPALMAGIRQRIKLDIEAHKDARPAAPRYQGSSDKPSEHQAGELVRSEELRYLNQHYNFAPALDLNSVTTHRRGPLGKVIVRVKRKILVLIWNLLKEYFDAEREWHANLVRYLNHESKYIDSRDASNFWELIRKIDYDITKALERIERISDEQMASIRSSERRVFDSLDDSLKDLREGVAGLRTESVQQNDQLNVLEGVARGLEHIVADLGKPKRTRATSAKASGDAKIPDFSYRLLENRFRGSEDEIARRLGIYPELFAGQSKPIVEIGGGRGELLELFNKRGIESYSVDLDEAQVLASAGKGLDARVGDGIAHLRSLKANSIGGVIAIQVVEHLSKDQLEELVRLAASRVVRGGKIVFETINPKSVLALSSNYFRDLTHVFPLHPDTLEYLMTLSGLRVLEVRPLSPVADEAQLRPLEIDPYMTPRWAFAVETLNRNFAMLNEMLYGYQDYCIIAEVQ